MRVANFFASILIILNLCGHAYSWDGESHQAMHRLALELLKGSSLGECLSKNAMAMQSLSERLHEGYGKSDVTDENNYFHLDLLLGEVEEGAISRLPSDLSYHVAYPVYRSLVREHRGAINKAVQKKSLKIKGEEISLAEVTARGLLLPNAIDLTTKSVARFRAGDFKEGFYLMGLFGYHLDELANPWRLTGKELSEPRLPALFEQTIHSVMKDDKSIRTISRIAKKNGGRDLEVRETEPLNKQLFELSLSSFSLLKVLTNRYQSGLWEADPTKGETTEDIARDHLGRLSVALARSWTRVYEESIDKRLSVKKEWEQCPLINYEQSYQIAHAPRADYLDDVRVMLGYQPIYKKRELAGDNPPSYSTITGPKN